MKLLFALSVFLLVVFGTAKPQIFKVSSELSTFHRLDKVKSATECSMCAQFMDQFLETILNEILNGGVIAGCGALCTKVTKGNAVAKAVCNLLCDYVGIEAFIELVKKADLDPVWMCEEIKFCKKTTCTSNCATISSVTVDQNVTRAGNFVNFTVLFSIADGVGVSSIAIRISGTTPDKKGHIFKDIELGFLPEPKPGDYQGLIAVETADQDPNGGQPIPWAKDTYTTLATFCDGLCGSDHKGSGEILARLPGPNFQLV